MDRFVLIARLKPGGRGRALALLAEDSALGMEELEAKRFLRVGARPAGTSWGASS
jgi:hypothetical protein